MGNRPLAPHASGGGGGEPRHQDESFRHGVAPRDAAVAEARSGGEQQGAVRGAPPRRPSYVPLWQRRVEEEEEKK
uniref:Uncharacterized protein n=1 Tax=Oryza meridionalis TaxID=40149 RepID=A0A0E0CBW6_9ORYZ